jgi:gas vesicle protein
MGEIKMDQETKDYLDRRLLMLVKKEDIEKLRQETKANSRQWKEENRTQILEVIQEIKADLEQWKREERQAIDSLRQEVNERQTSPDQWAQNISSFLQQIKGEIQSNLDPFKQEMGKHLQLIREEETTERIRSGEEWKSEIHQLGKGQEELREETKRVADQASSIHQKIKEGLTETKEELGAMIRFSFADLEKRMNAQEARIKALEKMIFH